MIEINESAVQKLNEIISKTANPEQQMLRFSSAGFG